MFDFYQRRKLRTFLSQPLTRLVLLILAILMVWAAYTRYSKLEMVSARRAEVENEVEHLRQQKETLQKQVEYLSDDRGIEAEMRRQFDVALPGEQVVVIVDPEHKDASTTPLGKKGEDHPWYMFWR